MLKVYSDAGSANTTHTLYHLISLVPFNSLKQHIIYLNVIRIGNYWQTLNKIRKTDAKTKTETT